MEKNSVKMSYSKKRNYNVFFIALFLLGMNFRIHGQQEMINILVNSFNSYSQQNLQEKIFAHTDKSFYVCGEVLWFKLYNADAYLNKPIAISKIAYVELLNNEQKPILQAKIELRDGTGNGSFTLPFSLNSGIYTLRAYTNWMKNYSPDLFFETRLTIVNTLKKLNPSENDSATYDIRFFPEGGNLVAGLPSKVAFHAVGGNGNGIFCRGTVYNQNNDSITSFGALRFGMGHFSFTPAKGDSYKAIVQTGSGTSITRPIPLAYENGYVMHLNPASEGTIRITVHSGNNDEFLFLLVHTRQVIKLADSKIITNGLAEFTINKKELGEGISHFTLFNSRRQPVCERLYFFPPKEKLNIEIHTDQAEYERRKKVIVQLETVDKNMLPVKADLSMAVFMTDSLQSINESDIQSYLWLSSELKETIESPLYYFNSTESDKEEVTDNLMLTQGWSRFKWEDVLKTDKPSFQFLPEYEGPVITGRIIERSSGLPAKNVATWLSVPGEKFVLGSNTSDQNGNVIFNLNKFYGSNELIVQPAEKQKTTYTISIENVFAENFSSRKYPSFRIEKKWEDQLLSYSINTQVENTYVPGKKQKFYHYKHEDSTAFYGKPDRTYLLDDYTRFITMEEVMREFVTEVRVRKQQDELTFRVKHLPYQVFFDNAPLVLLDGLPVLDMNKLMEFDPLKIKKLEVVAKKFYSGNDIIEGIVSYTTYKANLDGFQIDPNALVLEYEGLQLQREFYSPMYATKEQAESRLPDFRNLLYWSPDIKTDEKGSHDVNFYTSDRPGRYAVVVQGINSNAVAGSKVVYFTVNQ
ncbi:MAG: hypothetical protein ACXWV2_01510 [Chitinophagaceae bacterium]